MNRELEHELETYRRELPKLLCQPGKYVLIGERKVVNVFDSYKDALVAGYGKFKTKPFLVKQIQPEIQVHYFTRDFEPCHT